MTIKLYQCLCENNRMNKESYLNNEIVLECVARIPFNKTNPVIIIENFTTIFDLMFDDNKEIVFGDNQEIGIERQIDIANYCYIVEWERYYFIDNITYNSNKIITFNCSLDVLMSFKNKEWTKNPLYITRRTNGNPFISDNMLQFTYKKQIIESLSSDVVINPNGYNFDFATSNENVGRKYCFIVAFSKYDTDIQGEAPYKPGYYDTVPQATKNSTNSHLGCDYFVINGYQLWVLLRYYYMHSDESGLIKNIMYLPYDIEYDPESARTSIGPVDFEQYHIQIDEYPVYEAKYYNYDRWKYCTIKIPKANSFRDFEPYTQAYLSLPYAETIELELQKIRSRVIDAEIEVYYYVDYETGNSSYMIKQDTRIIKTGTLQLGFKFTITTSNLSENARAHENNITALTLGTIASGVNSLSPSGINPMKLASGLIGNISQYIQRENSIATRSQASANSTPTGALLFYSKPKVEYIYNELTFKGEDRGKKFEYYKNNIGIPFNDYEFIYNILDGEHVIIGDTSDVTMSSDMTSNELNLLRQALANGFYK